MYAPSPSDNFPLRWALRTSMSVRARSSYRLANPPEVRLADIPLRPPILWPASFAQGYFTASASLPCESLLRRDKLRSEASCSPLWKACDSLPNVLVKP